MALNTFTCPRTTLLKEEGMKGMYVWPHFYWSCGGLVGPVMDDGDLVSVLFSLCVAGG